MSHTKLKTLLLFLFHPVILYEEIFVFNFSPALSKYRVIVSTLWLVLSTILPTPVV